MKEGGILIGKLISSSASAATAATQSASGSSAASLSALLLGVLLERSGLRGLQVQTGGTWGRVVEM